ncbi:MAG: ion transporter, partial [Deltaproteobacteria bacterium]|nr:ion transporter [Deltaproteobacteria bacterium]
MSQARTVSRLESVVESALFRQIVLGLIMLNAVIVGLETYPQIESRYGWLLHLADRGILYLFTVE